MPSKKIFALFAIVLIIVLGQTALVRAQSTPDEQIPSDLSLDLDLAQKDPAPAQKQIVQSQTPTAATVTNQGEQAVLLVKDEVPEEIKVQSAKDTENPQQTTSEQVISKNVEEPNGQNNNGQFNSAGQPVESTSPTTTPASKDIIPGTNIEEPDDNTAVNPDQKTPQPSSAGQGQNQPPESPAPSVPQTSDQPSSTNTQPVSTSAAPAQTTSAEGTSQPNPIPPENAPAQNPAPSSSSNESGGNNSSGSSTGEENPAVQGVSTQFNLPWWQSLLNKVLKHE